ARIFRGSRFPNWESKVRQLCPLLSRYWRNPNLLTILSTIGSVWVLLPLGTGRYLSRSRVGGEGSEFRAAALPRRKAPQVTLCHPPHGHACSMFSFVIMIWLERQRTYWF